MANCYTSKIIICRGVRPAVLVEIGAYMYCKSANALTPLFDLVPCCPVSRWSPLLYGLSLSRLAMSSLAISAPLQSCLGLSAPV